MPPESSDPNVDTTVLWDESRLKQLIKDGIEENHSLEYKSAAALSRSDRDKTEITKDVSAMANSAGGTLIYGIAEFRDELRKHLPERVDPVLRTNYSKEWLEQITSQIRPRIHGLRIHSVPLSSAPDHVAYVVEIPQGATAHQANNYCYYRRYNFESVPMADHEVRDVMNRKAHPKISVTAQLFVYRFPNLDGTAGSLIFGIQNESDILARYVALIAHSPLKIRGQTISYSHQVYSRRPA